jgi:esterase/lipase superfamily enzyme
MGRAAGRHFRSGLLRAGLAAALIALTCPALAYDPSIEFRLTDALANGDRAAAARVIETALAGETDPKITEDLLDRLAAIYAEEGRHADAAAAYKRRAEAIAKRAGSLSPELIPVWEKAATEFEEAGDAKSAVAALTQLLALLRSAGLAEKADAYLDRLGSLAETTADAETAETARTAIADHETAVDETSRDFPTDPEKGFSTVKIYYATDRARTDSDIPAEFYGGERGALELGTATVSIPAGHKPGAIEAPSIWTLDFRADPERHVVLESVTPDTAENVFGQMRAQVEGTGKAEAFVFVHGFNVPFNEAAMRTAQMAYDMNFDGLPILFSWPSRASVLDYISDTAVVNLSGRRLSHFLDDVVAKSGATRIHLIAHSMGNRALTDALELFALRHKGEPPAFDQVLFTAPDLDAGLFAVMVDTFRTVAQRMTLYASNRDWALAVSKKLHGNAPRAGQGGRNIIKLAAIDSIDMTPVGEDMLAHSYYANNPSALTDILSLFWRDAAPDYRCGMTKTESAEGGYWSYTPELCDSGALLSTLTLLRRGKIASIQDARKYLNEHVPTAAADPGEKSRLQRALSKLFRGS